jgi:hypothetical protein
MSRFYFFITILLIPANVIYSQPLPSVKPERIEHTKYKIRERLSFYPFNKASKVAIVSFSANIDSSIGSKILHWGLPVINDTVSIDRLDQMKVLASSEIEKLTDILYNNCSRWTIIEKTGMGCYLPRNEILFLDGFNRTFAYVEICFECHGLKRSESIDQIDECDMMYQDLQTYFKSLGIKTSAAEIIKQHKS